MPRKQAAAERVPARDPAEKVGRAGPPAYMLQFERPEMSPKGHSFALSFPAGQGHGQGRGKGGKGGGSGVRAGTSNCGSAALPACAELPSAVLPGAVRRLCAGGGRMWGHAGLLRPGRPLAGAQGGGLPPAGAAGAAAPREPALPGGCAKLLGRCTGAGWGGGAAGQCRRGALLEHGIFERAGLLIIYSVGGGAVDSGCSGLQNGHHKWP